ncbi:MAG: uracil-DNA glycosylase [Christensenella sp.]|uniref:uracil-DNA glycosylase n=1 Tax=Christensenella sp. TaxID=1935934 RepID=UPI002B1EC85C|nr:uracil-DNA glycosylase [Christensenella sp.]MEA5002463.1 uracil-DNA glycosylase [Christensenella sp.]
MLDRLYHEIDTFYEDTPLVFGDGNRQAKLLLIGEAPGKDEVALGRPFVGKAGKNLDGFLQVIGLAREDIYITNVCKFRPHKISEKGRVSNRPPTKQEIAIAADFLLKEIGMIAPQTIVTLGNTPLRAVLGDFSANIGAYHGQAQPVHVKGQAYTLFALYHPASIIYNPPLKTTYEQDLGRLADYLSNTNKK